MSCQPAFTAFTRYHPPGGCSWPWRKARSASAALRKTPQPFLHVLHDLGRASEPSVGRQIGRLSGCRKTAAAVLALAFALATLGVAFGPDGSSASVLLFLDLAGASGASALSALFLLPAFLLLLFVLFLFCFRLLLLFPFLFLFVLC